MRRLLIDNEKTDPRDSLYGMPWDNDSICYNFNMPDEFVLDTEISQIPDMKEIETLVIVCKLDDYGFISKMENLRQLYIYSGENITELDFLENLVNLTQLYIADSHVTSLDKLVRLTRKQKAMLLQMEPIKRILFGLHGICIESDCKNLNGNELIEPTCFISEIKINGKWLIR